MRKLPSKLAAFFILITISRVAAFAVLGLKLGWLGYAFAIGLAVGVYVSAYFIRFKETRWPSIFSLTVFMIADLWFNEFELIRTLSTQQLLPPDANFLNYDVESLRRGMEISAIVYGFFPTIAAALLGWMQSGAERVASLKVRHWFGKFGIAFAAKIERWFPENEEIRSSRVVDGTVVPDGSGKRQLGNSKTRWEALSPSQIAEVAGKTDAAIIALYGGSVRRARMWRQWARSGK